MASTTASHPPSSTSSSSSPPTSSGPTKPPKSKTEPYYTISPLWTDITPIPQLDLESTPIPGVPSSTGPALATIVYTPRYAEAMSYLRAVMAANEFSQRALALTEDVIGMNPAHYTVWLYRFRVLRELWGIGGPEEKGVDGEKMEMSPVGEEVVKGVEEELVWLDRVSERHLKNYQIWHHRHSLVALLPSLPSTELDFLQHILSFDTKNYHVWSYRQWLCTRFSDPLLTTAIELTNTATMLDDDVRNNSAWSHRYFIAFGHKELAELEQRKARGGSGVRGKDFRVEVVDLEVVDREIEFVKERVGWAPQNISAWNYLRGVLRHAGMSVLEMKEFAAQFVGEDYDFDTEHDEDQRVRGVRSSYAVDMLVEVFDEEGTPEGRVKVRHGLAALATKWDPIRRKYWEYRLKRYEEKWKEMDA